MKFPNLKWFSENLTAKLMSLLIACLLWVALIDEPDLLEIVIVPVEYRNLSPQLDLAPGSITRVQVQVRGPRGRLNEVSAESTNIVLDLASMRKPATSTFTIEQGNLNLPPRVHLVRATPSQLRIQLERRTFLNVLVMPDFEEKLPDGIKPSSFEITPAAIQIVGPESRVNAITTLKTEPIDLSSLEIGKAIRLHVILPDPELSFSGPSQVSLKALIDLKSPSK